LQIIGSDEESIENSEFSWEKKNLNNSQRSFQNTCIQEITHIKSLEIIVISKNLLNLTIFGNLQLFYYILAVKPTIAFTVCQTFLPSFQTTLLILTATQ